VSSAKEIAEHVMLSGLTTPHDLKVKFGLDLKSADKAYRLSAYAFGPGGKGFNWYVKKIEGILKGKTMNVVMARELVKVARSLLAGPAVPVEIGDTILIGKFKNRKAIVKGFGLGKLNQPVVLTDKGEIMMFKFRIPKLIKGV
jgi:hypothetical protein